MLRSLRAMVGLLVLAMLVTVSPLLATSMNFEWPVDKVTGEPVERLELCKVDRKNHTRHAVAAAGGSIVAWQYTFRSLAYQLVEADTPMSWTNCLASCIYKAPSGYTMLVTESEEENEVIRTLLVNSPDYNCTTGMGRSAWLAITDALDEGNMTYFMDGSPLNYTNYAEHQPNDDNVDGQDCLRILASGTLDGKWEDIGCDIIWGAQQMCICRRDNKPSTAAARYLGVTNAGKKYWTLATPRSWEGCRMGCLREAKGRMAVAATPEDYKSVLLYANDAASSLGLDSVWLGATDILLEGNWNWLDGTPLAADAPWAPEQPDNLRTLQQKLDEDGLRLHTSGNLTGLYTDEYIGRMAACLCETD